MAAKAHLWVVIALRSGPGRHFEQGDADSDPRNEPIWTSAAAQNAYVEMWRHVAARFKNNPVVAGYVPMVEPNHAAELDFIDPKTYDDNPDTPPIRVDKSAQHDLFATLAYWGKAHHVPVAVMEFGAVRDRPTSRRSSTIDSRSWSRPA